MNNKFEAITTLAQDYMRTSREMSFVLQEYKREILMKYKFNYTFDGFINEFVYESDRQDSESISYLINKTRSKFLI